MNKLTKAEKQLRGTLRKSRETEPRTLQVIQKEIVEAEQTTRDMHFNLKLAMDQIRKHGLMVKAKVLDSHGKAVSTEKINPAFKVQREALSAIRSLKRYKILLCEEESQASQKQTVTKDSEFDDFI